LRLADTTRRVAATPGAAPPKRAAPDRGRVYALRFRAYGKRYVTLPDDTTRTQAEQELANVLADVPWGAWRPKEPAPTREEPDPDPDFHRFLSEWLATASPSLAEKTKVRYR
jgi:hypothetical protein